MFGEATYGNSSTNYQAFTGFSGGGGGTLSEQEITAGAIEMGSDPDMVQAMLSNTSEGAGDTHGGGDAGDFADLDEFCGYSAAEQALAQAAGKARGFNGSIDRKFFGYDGDEEFGSQAHTHILRDCPNKLVPRVQQRARKSMSDWFD